MTAELLAVQTFDGHESSRGARGRQPDRQSRIREFSSDFLATSGREADRDELLLRLQADYAPGILVPINYIRHSSSFRLEVVELDKGADGPAKRPHRVKIVELIKRLDR